MQGYLKKVMGAKEIDLAMNRIAAEILEDHQDLQTLALVGIRRRGVPLAQSLQKKIEELSGTPLDLGVLDITFYRDDLSLVDSQPVVGSTSINFDVSRRTVILVDDVLYTGRTTRAAIESVLAYGRPKRVQMAVLVDRGHRELPIYADYIGKTVETDDDEVIEVKVPEIDGDDAVYLTNQELLKQQEAAR